MKRIQNDVDHEAAIVDYVQRYCAKKGLPSDWNGVRKIILLLRQRGFDDDSISGALKRIVPTALLLRLETGEELDKQHSDP
jgi:SOS response regulatory protein OraA/RecX